jgi:hypothetical protein
VSDLERQWAGSMVPTVEIEDEAKALFALAERQAGTPVLPAMAAMLVNDAAPIARHQPTPNPLLGAPMVAANTPATSRLASGRPTLTLHKAGPSEVSRYRSANS